MVAVTGAHGFVGHGLCAHLEHAGFRVTALVRAAPAHPVTGRAYVTTGNLEDAGQAALEAALRDACAVVHLAGRAHVLDEHARDPEAAYTAANEVATARLAAAAVAVGVPRFVFASTVKVNGEATSAGKPFEPGDPPAPVDAYARSKLRAEEALSAVCAGSATRALVLRLPLVYGPGMRGNAARLLDAIAAGRRLPVGAVRNRRSILYVVNLHEAIAAALAPGSSVTGVHFVADGESVSTPQLALAMGEALGIPARLIDVPVPLLRAMGALAGRGATIARLVGTLEVDATSFMRATGWVPRHDLAAGLAESARWWRTHHAI